MAPPRSPPGPRLLPAPLPRRPSGCSPPWLPARPWARLPPAPPVLPGVPILPSPCLVLCCSEHTPLPACRRAQGAGPAEVGNVAGMSHDPGAGQGLGEQGGTAQAGPRWGCAPRPALPPALALGWVPATASRGLPGTCQALCRQTGSLSPWCGWWGGDSKDQREEVKRLQSVTGRPGPLRLSGGSGPVLRS